MKAEYINPFLVAVAGVLQELIPDLEIERLPLQKLSTPMLTKGCASLIGVTGEVEGRVVFEMEINVAVKLASGMIGEELTEFDTMVSSSINEIANMICGRAISILNDSGKKLDISAPTIFVGQEMTLYDSSIVGEALVIPLKSNFGELFINVALTD